MVKFATKKALHPFFVWVYLASLIFIGVAYLSIMPIFEGFDENAHYSNVRQISATGIIPQYGKSYLDQFIVEFHGPVPYNTDTPPFDQGLVYQKFFQHPEHVTHYQNTYRASLPLPPYQPSHQLNWQAQHPPLYYVLLAPLLSVLEQVPFSSQIFFLRMISFLLAVAGVALGLLSVYQSAQTREFNVSILGFLCYPIVLPMFFPEFTRIGNDSLCLFLVGLIAYFLSLWFKDEYNVKKSIVIGSVLGLGLLTKALFLPIAGALIVFSISRLKIEPQTRSKKIRSLLCILLSALLIGGGWYAYQWITVGQLSGSGEAISLAQQGGLVAGLKEKFSLFGFLRALLVPFVTYSWAGTWSMVRLPAYFHVPLLILAAWIFIASMREIKQRPFSDSDWFPVWLLVFFAIGFLWHILVNLALHGTGGTPGWYLHILMPWIAPALGLGINVIVQHRHTKIVFMALLIYAVLYQIATWWSQLALFTGCASKGLDKYYAYSGNFFCLDQTPLLMERLSVLGYPALAIVGLVGGVITNVWLFRCAWKNKIGVE